MPKITNKLRKEIVIYCPLCNHDYTPSGMKTVEKSEETVLSYGSCPKCNGSMLSFMYKDFFGVTMVGIATDLNFEEVIKYKSLKPIESKDVLDIYEFFAG